MNATTNDDDANDQAAPYAETEARMMTDLEKMKILDKIEAPETTAQLQGREHNEELATLERDWQAKGYTLFSHSFDKETQAYSPVFDINASRYYDTVLKLSAQATERDVNETKAGENILPAYLMFLAHTVAAALGEKVNQHPNRVIADILHDFEALGIWALTEELGEESRPQPTNLHSLKQLVLAPMLEVSLPNGVNAMDDRFTPVLRSSITPGSTAALDDVDSIFDPIHPDVMNIVVNMGHTLFAKTQSMFHWGLRAELQRAQRAQSIPVTETIELNTLEDGMNIINQWVRRVLAKIKGP